MSFPCAGSIRIFSDARKGIPRMASCSCNGATTNSAGLQLSHFSAGMMTLLTTFLLTSVPWGFIGSHIRIGGIGRVGIACFSTLSDEMTLMVAPQSARDEGNSTFRIVVPSLIVGTEEQEYSESESDSTTVSNALTDSFFTPFAFSDSNLSGQPVATWSTLILRH